MKVVKLTVKMQIFGTTKPITPKTRRNGRKRCGLGTKAILLIPRPTYRKEKTTETTLSSVSSSIPIAKEYNVENPKKIEEGRFKVLYLIVLSASGLTIRYAF